MNKAKCKFAAIILITVIFFSIFFVEWSTYSLNRTHATMYPAFKNLSDEDLSYTEEINQVFSWSKNIFYSFYIKNILLSIEGSGDSNSIKLYNLKSETLEFYFYSVLIASFINKKDGKKYDMFILLS